MKDVMVILVALCSVAVLAITGCDADEKKNDNDNDTAKVASGVTGSCTGEQKMGDLEEGAKLCVEFEKYAEKTAGEMKKKCEGGMVDEGDDDEDKWASPVWSDGKCATEGVTAKCTAIPNPHGGSSGYYSYNTLFNAIIQEHLCKTQGEFKEVIAPKKLNGAIEVKGGGKVIMCIQVIGVSEALWDMLSSKFESAGGLTKDKTCEATGVVHSCSEKNEAGFTELTNYYDEDYAKEKKSECKGDWE